MRRPASRVFHAWCDFAAIEVVGGLILLYAAAGQVLVIPRRLLNTEQFIRVVESLVFEEDSS